MHPRARGNDVAVDAPKLGDIFAPTRAQADILMTEARGKMRLAEEYDAAQERGEVSAGRPKSLPDGNTSATVSDVGLTSKQVHEARQIRDAENADPGIAERALNAMVSRGQVVTAAQVKEIKQQAAAEAVERITLRLPCSGSPA